MRKYIALEYEQIDSIVVSELQEAYEMNLDPELNNQKLLDAIETVLDYYMASMDFADWKLKYENRN